MIAAAVRPETLYAWRGPALLIVDPRGECGPDEPLSGLYYREARFLSALRFSINDRRPWLCETAALAPDRLAFSYTYPEISAPGGGGTGQSQDDEGLDADGVPERALNLRLEYHVTVGGLDVHLSAANASRRPVSVRLGWAVDADFADIQEALSGGRQQQATVTREAHGSVVQIAYGHPVLHFHTRVHHPADWRATETGLEASVTLAPSQSASWLLRIEPVTGTDDLSVADVRARDEAWQNWRDDFTRVEIPSNTAAERMFASNVADIASFAGLTGEPDEWLTPMAGMPLYPAFFGRDAITAGWQIGCLDGGRMLDASLTRLGRLQSDRFHDWTDEQPGRIPYQVRTGPLALLDLNPYAGYYADYASPLMFVISLANLFAWTGDRTAIEPHWDAARRICDWARTHGDADGDGYLEYQTLSSKGTKNQGWKDSGDAIVYEDGSPVPAPIATCELQGYWYIAQELMAALSFVMGDRDDASAYRKSASALKERFNRDWWVEEQQSLALALDPDKRQVRAVTSNVGHCLATGIIDAAHMPAVVERLFAPDMFSGWGIRTLSSDHAYYNPISYHRGSVWAVEQATVIFGLRRFGFDARALELSRAVFDLAALYSQGRIPECVGGYGRTAQPTPGAYPKANTPQLWNASGFPLILQTLLGLLPLAPINTLIVDPCLPSWLPEVIVRDMRVGDARVSLRFRREGDRTDWDVLHTTGTLHIVRQPPPESLHAGVIDRIRGLVESVWK